MFVYLAELTVTLLTINVAGFDLNVAIEDGGKLGVAFHWSPISVAIACPTGPSNSP